MAMLTVGIGATVPTWAQPATEAGGLEEIVVTARKTSESLQITPVAVTALSEATLLEKQVLEVTDLQRTTPSISVATGGTGPASIVYLAIRGQAQTSPNSASDASVGIYVDGVYIGRPVVGNVGMLDVGRAEILRGPQGTLFGRNTTGGALNIVTNQPNGEFEGSVKVGGGNYSARNAEGVINLPIMGDELAVRFAGRYAEHDGYVYNPIRNSEYQDLEKNYTGRGQLRWAPGELPVTAVLSADYDDYHDNGTPASVLGINDNQPLGNLGPLGLVTVGRLFTLSGLNSSDYVYDGSNFDKTFQDPRTGRPELDTPQNSNLARGTSLNVDVDLGGVDLKSITAYRESNTTNSLDIDGTPVQLIAFFTEYNQHQFSQELQASGTIGSFDVIGGLFYFTEAGDERSDNKSLGAFTDLFGIRRPFNRTFSTFEAESKAAFVQTNYKFNDRLRATVGYRYTWDNRKVTRRGYADLELGTCGIGIPGTAFNCRQPLDGDFSYPAWTVGLDFQVTDDLFVYAKTSAASMAGGFNTRTVPTGRSDSFQPESVKDVELGVKADFLDDRIRTNVAVFHAWNEGVQRVLNDFFLGTLTQFVTNAGDTRTYGVEVEATALPWTGMELSATASYLHAEYKKGSFVETRGTESVDRSGEPLPYAPEYTFTVGATQSVDLPFGTLAFHADYSYVDDRVFYVDSPLPSASPAVKAAFAQGNEFGVVDSYGVLGARISLSMPQTNLEFALWGSNLTNKEYFTNVFVNWTGLGVATQNQGRPRTYGATLTYSF
jgi:iron complex outermembrane receptor protein